MRKEDFAAAVGELQKGDRVRVRLREGCFKPTENFDGSHAGRVFEIGPSLICLAIKREGLRWFNFYPVESITRLPKRGDA